MGTAGELFDIARGFLAVGILGIFAFLGFAAFAFAMTLMRRSQKARRAGQRKLKREEPVEEDLLRDDEWSKDFG